MAKPLSQPSSPHGYYPEFRKAASDYYDVDEAIAFLNTSVPRGCQRWRCVLCGWSLDIQDAQARVIGACACGGCGQTTMRPIADWSA